MLLQRPTLFRSIFSLVLLPFFLGSAFVHADSDIKQKEELQLDSLQKIDSETETNWYKQRWKQKQQTEDIAGALPFVLVPHQPNYILPITLIEKPNQQPIEYLRSKDNQDVDYQHVEIEMQMSVKYRFPVSWIGKPNYLEFGYTNRSYWQAYNGSISYSFREVIHQPELMLTHEFQDSQWFEQVTLSANHESNGRDGKASRSWNRIILSTDSITSAGLLNLRGWWRIPEFLRTEPTDTGDPDDSDMIQDYLGYGEIGLIHHRDNSKYSVKINNNFSLAQNRSSITLGWTFPLSRGLEGYVQYFNGYGPALIDFNSHQHRLGFGFKLSDLL